MSQALYRTYRSRSFGEIVGQHHVTDLLERAIAQGKVSHAYLLTGPRGVGKTSVARIIAHTVNDLEYSENPNLDIIEIDAASNRRIDDIRDLREKVHVAPLNAKYKVYIIDEVHMLTGESFNALLKTLEEPPVHVIFILATTEVHKVPATIISRTQRYHLRPAKVGDIVSHLTDIAKKESISHDDGALELIAQHAGGSFRDSVSLLDQLSGLSETLTTELVESVLGMADRGSLSTLLDALTAGDISSVIEIIETLENQGISPIVLTEQLSNTVYEKAKSEPSLYALLDTLTDVPKAYNPQLKLIAVLVRYTKEKQPKRAVAVSIPKKPSVVASAAELKENVAKRKKESVKSPKPVHAIATASSVHSEATDFTWVAVLSSIKKHHAPLYSVLSRAEVSYDMAKNSLTLTFVYALHRKKLEHPTYRKQLGAVLSDLFGINPELIITDTKSTLAMSSDAQAVAAIMGGGEPVSGTI